MSAITEPQETSSTSDTEQPSQFVRLKKFVTDGEADRGSWKKEATRAYDFVAGWQWSEEDQRILDEQHRPAVTFNRTGPMIKAVCGLEENNRQDVIYLPRKEGDAMPDETRTAAVRWVRDQTGAAFEESESFRDLAICGEGWTETRLEHDENPMGKVVEERIDPLEMGVNAGAFKANYSDARAIYRIREIDAYDAEDMFPGVERGAIHAGWATTSPTPEDGGTGNKKDYPDKTREGLSGRGSLTKCRIVQIQWWERETMHLVAAAADREPVEMTPEDFAKVQQRAELAGAPVQSVTIRKKCYYEAFLGADGILPIDAEGTTVRKLKVQSFSFRCMTGERDRKKKCFYGLLRDMFDPQMWANKWLAQTMNILNHNAKGGLIAEQDAFQNQRKAEEEWSDPTKIVFVKPGKLDKVKDRTPPPLPQGLNDLMMFALSSLRDTTGVNLELLGQADREQAASLEAQRRQSAMTILATMFGNLRRYRVSQGWLLLKFVALLPPNTLVRVLDKGQYKFVPLLIEGNEEDFDVIVDEAPSSPNQKQAIWMFIQQLLQTVQLPMPALVKLLKYSPLPETVVAEVEQAMGLGEEQPPEVLKQKIEQAEAALKVLEEKLAEALQQAESAENDRATEMLQLEIEEYKAKTARLAAMWTAQVKAATAVSDDTATPNPQDSE